MALLTATGGRSMQLVVAEVETPVWDEDGVRPWKMTSPSGASGQVGGNILVLLTVGQAEGIL